MFVPAADLPTPIAVLVLAWGEASPAVRALVAATAASAPTVDSILVMVPQADAPDHLSAEEYLPLTLPEFSVPAPAALAPPSSTVVTLPLAETPTPAPMGTTLLRAEALEEDGGPATDEVLLTSQPSTSPVSPAPALAWSAVRVLRLASHSLPQLAHLAGRPLPSPIWLGPLTPPAAPYLGAGLPVAFETTPPQPRPGPVEADDQLPALLAGAAGPLLADVSPVVAPGIPVSAPATTAPSIGSVESLPQTAALETDLPPREADELELFELASDEEVAQEDATPTLEQGGWPEALASLRQPTELALAVAIKPTAPAAAVPTSESASAAHPELRPAAGHYPAPDLNFQIIQYARFAVPVALADPTFDAIYAPAWPTWLAAQELRQRTGKPLVLHLAALAALGNESADTATGWIAELQRQALRRADLVLAETPALAQRLQHELGLAAGTVRVIAAADTEAIAQALHEARPRPVAGPA
jgi:hypothetical protein